MVVAGLFLAGCGKDAGKTAATDVSDRVFTVRRGDFPVIFRLDGQLDAIRNHRLQFRSKRGARELKLTFLLPEHTVVSSNEVVFQISDEYFIRQESDLLRRIQAAEQNLQMALRDQKIIEADNLNDLKTALDNLRTASDSYVRYRDEDAPKQKEKLLQNVQDKQDALRSAEENLQAARKTRTDAYSMEEAVAQDAERKVTEAEKSLLSARQSLDSAFYDLRVFKRYDHPQRLSTLANTKNRQHLAVQRTLVNNETRQAKKKLEIENAQAQLGDYNFELAEIRQDMAGLEMRAPTGGTLFYGDPDGNSRGWRGQTPEDLKVGADINNGQILGFIPDVDKFLVKINIPEEFRSRIRNGLKAVIHAKAVPDLILNGEITNIASAATPTLQWDPSSPKVYVTRVSTDRADPRLIPGMTVQADILVEHITDVLHLPIEAVYNREGQAYVRALKGKAVEERPVQTGRFSTDYVEIIDGLLEGDTVLLIRSGT
ncbi:MAG: HlyD family efflux transporter periplasmic adaptor subunit [Kiritimatiellaeota bacterium]|nr:HlyD family efflux transporter periplasmic adaptor subunit [Kiritimatiellota bacterium]